MKRAALILALLAVFLALPAIAGASYPVANDTQWKPHALKWHRIVVKERRILVRHTDALELPRPRRVPAIVRDVLVYLPDSAAGETSKGMSWQRYGHDSKRVAVFWRDTRIPQLHRRLTHPGGSGAARWWPLASYVGWPRSERGNWIFCVRGESGGDPSTTGAAGEASLMQIHPIHAKTFKRVTGKAFWRYAWRAELNIRFGLWLWEREGWAPWTVMRAR